MASPFQSPAILSICPGIRGLERGLERAIGPTRTVAYVEIEAFCIYNLVAQMEAGILAPAPVYTDAKTFNGRPFRNRVHGITAGYPCQGESLAGLRQMQHDKRFLWPHLQRIIEAVKPVWCFFENVDDHLTGTFPIVLASLQKMGYTVEAGVFSSEEVGATFEGQRLFILALDTASFMRLQNSTNSAQHKEGNKVGNQKKIRKNLWVETNRHGFDVSRPARADEKQHDWEDDRIHKPGVGSTINGYNFIEDFLRALGNSVDEWAAEKAFRTLIKKFE